MILVPILASTVTAESGNPLSVYRWDKRPLLVFAGDGHNTNLRLMRRVITDNRCEIRDRDMVVIEILRPGDAR